MSFNFKLKTHEHKTWSTCVQTQHYIFWFCIVFLSLIGSLQSTLNLIFSSSADSLKHHLSATFSSLLSKPRISLIPLLISSLFQPLLTIHLQCLFFSISLSFSIFVSFSFFFFFLFFLPSLSLMAPSSDHINHLSHPCIYGTLLSFSLFSFSIHQSSSSKF